MQKSNSIVVLISGNGSNLQAIIDAINAGKLDAKIEAVISNKALAFGLERAKKAGIPVHVLENRAFPDRKLFETELEKIIRYYQPKLIILAGFMHILGAHFIHSFKEQILNIHPSLLPKYPGLNTHECVLECGDKEHGCSVHIVTEDVDAGPILAQAKLKVKPADTAETLDQRVKSLEHELYPKVIQQQLSS